MRTTSAGSRTTASSSRLFIGEVDRLARNDSTVQWRGIFYEVPPYLRRCKVRLRYSLLDISRVSLLDGNVEIPLRVVDPVANAHRRRNVSTPAASSEKPKTGLNAPDLILENMIRPRPEPGRGSACKRRTQMPRTRKEAAMNKLLSTYGLTREPFTKDIAPSEMLQTEPLQEALQSLKAAIGRPKPPPSVTGDSGCGKTCLLRALEEDLPQGRYRLHYAYNSTVNRRDFYRQLSIGMGLEPHSSFATLHASVSQHIQELASQHKLRVIIVLDEAQLCCPSRSLEQLHILAQF